MNRRRGSGDVASNRRCGTEHRASQRSGSSHAPNAGSIGESRMTFRENYYDSFFLVRPVADATSATSLRLARHLASGRQLATTAAVETTLLSPSRSHQSLKPTSTGVKHGTAAFKRWSGVVWPTATIRLTSSWAIYRVSIHHLFSAAAFCSAHRKMGTFRPRQFHYARLVGHGGLVPWLRLLSVRRLPLGLIAVRAAADRRGTDRTLPWTWHIKGNVKAE